MRSLKTVLLVFCVSYLFSAVAITQAADSLANQHRLVAGPANQFTDRFLRLRYPIGRIGFHNFPCQAGTYGVATGEQTGARW